MKEALREARLAFDEKEVPIGAVIVKDNKIIAAAHNLCETNCDSTAHAEILAIRQAEKASNSRFLDGCDMYVTLEPCPMCAGAIIGARIARLYFGAFEPKTGACGSVINLFLGSDAYKKTDVFPEVLSKEAVGLMSDFFKTVR